MQSTSPEYKGALGTTHTPVATVAVDWDRDGTADDVEVSQVTVRRAITSDLDQGVTRISGLSVTEVDIDLAGDPDDNSKHPAALYSPFNADAALADVDVAGAPVTVELGVQLPAAPELLSQFTGSVRDIPVVAADRSASLTALDGGSERLRIPPQLPVVVGYDLLGVGSVGGLNTQWVVDYLAQRGGYDSCPPPRPGCVLSATLHGSAGATVGTALNSNYFAISDDGFADVGTRVPYMPGNFALAPAPAAGTEFSFVYSLAESVTTQSTDSLTFSGWVDFAEDVYADFDFPLDPFLQQTFMEHVTLRWAAKTDATDPATSVLMGATSAGTTHITVRVTRNGSDTGHVATGVDVTATGWHYVGVSIAFSTTTATVTYRVDDTVVGTETFTVTGPSAGDPDLDLAEIEGATSCEAVQITTERTADTEFAWDDGFTPTAVLEPGLSELIATPVVPADADCWTLIQQIAAAEAGVALIDELGVFQWWNRRHWWASGADSASVQRTIDASDALLDCTISRGIDRVRNVIQVSATPVAILDNSVIWQETATVSVPANGTLVRLADLGQNQAYNVNTSGVVIPTGGPLTTTGADQSGYRACTTVDGTGSQVSNLTMTIEPFASTIKITFTNPNPFEVFLVSPSGGSSPLGGGTFPATSDGQPSVALVGRLITTNPPGIDDTTGGTSSGVVAERRWQPSIDVFGEQVLTLPASPWMQRAEDADALAAALLKDTAWPKPQLTPVSIVADPSLQLGDRVQVSDDSGATGLDDPFWITGSTLDYQGGDQPSATQSLDLRPVARPRQWILGITGRSELGVTTIV